MKIISNDHKNTIKPISNTVTSDPANSVKTDTGSKPSAKTDTITISVEGREFIAKKAESDTEMFAMKLSEEDAAEFSKMLKSSKSFTISENAWKSASDPYFAIRDTARIEARIMELQDPNGARNDKVLDAIADKYAEEKLKPFTEQYKAKVMSETTEDRIREANEYKLAYDIYHSDNKSNLSMVPADLKQAYDIYSKILDGSVISIEEHKYLIMRNRTMYTGANSEYLKRTEDEYKASHGGKLPWE